MEALLWILWPVLMLFLAVRVTRQFMGLFCRHLVDSVSGRIRRTPWHIVIAMATQWVLVGISICIMVVALISEGS